MQVTSNYSIKKASNNFNKQVKNNVNKSNFLQKSKGFSSYNCENLRANYCPVSFKGNAPMVKSAFIITNSDNDIPLMATRENGSYLVDFDSQTEVIYGIDAINYLRNNTDFPYDTQVILPKKCSGMFKIDGNEIPLSENYAVMLNAGTSAKIDITEGNPMVVLSKKDYDWYERYGQNANDANIKNKFSELIYYNSHLYNGDFSPSMFLSEKFKEAEFLNGLDLSKDNSKNNLLYDIYQKKDCLLPEDRQEIETVKTLVDKLFSTGLIEQKTDGYIRFKTFYNTKHQNKIMKELGFTASEIERVLPTYDLTRRLHSESRFCRKNPSKDFSPHILSKLKQEGILFNNKKDVGNIYWRESFANEENLRSRLNEVGLYNEDQEEVVNNWKNINYTGFDISGLKFLNADSAVYSLDDKINNWTLEKTNWVTNSTALSSSKGITPFVGVSMVQTDENKVFSMDDLRRDERLHSHPNLNEKRQTELYMITSGAAALIVVKDGQPQIRIIKVGDLAVVGAGVSHCVAGVLGEYEHIVAQVPSAFQYGYGFKLISEPPKGYDDKSLKQESVYALSEARTLGLI